MSGCRVQLADWRRAGLGYGRGARGGQSVLCPDPSRIRRRPASFTPGTTAPFANTAPNSSTRAAAPEGIDVQADFGFGSFNANVNASFLDSYAESPFPGAAFIDYAGTSQDTSYFDYQPLSTVNYIRGPMSIGLRWQHLPSVDPPPGSAVSFVGSEVARPDRRVRELEVRRSLSATGRHRQSDERRSGVGRRDYRRQQRRDDQQPLRSDRPPSVPRVASRVVTASQS